MQDKIVKAFVIGSSLPVTIWGLTIASISNQSRAVCPQDLPIECLAIGMPFLFGLINVLLVLYGQRNPQWSTIIAGVIIGLLYASYGTLITDHHCHLYRIHSDQKYIAFIIEPLLHAAIWGIVVFRLNQFFGLYES